MTCFSSCISGFAATVALVAFVFDIVIFFVAKSSMNSVEGGSASIGNAVWLTLVAWILLFFSGCFYTVGRCCIRRRSRDAWGGKVGTPIGANGYQPNEQMRLDAVKAEADRKARQAQPEVGLPAFHEYDPSQPLKGRVDGDEVYVEEDVPYRDNRSVSNASMGTYGRAAGRGYAGGGYMQAPLGTRAVDEYNNASSYPPGPQRRASNITTTTTPSMYPPSSSTAIPPSIPVAAMYGPSDNQYNQDPYGPQAYGHNTGCKSSFPSLCAVFQVFPDDPNTQQSHAPYDPYGAFSPDTYNPAAAMVDNPQSPYGVPYNAPRSPTLRPEHGYALGGAAYGATTAPVNDSYNDPYYGHYQAPSNPTPPPMSRSPLAIDTQVTGAPTSVSPVKGPRGPKNTIVMAPPPNPRYTDSPPMYDSGAPGRWGNRG